MNWYELISDPLFILAIGIVIVVLFGKGTT